MRRLLAGCLALAGCSAPPPAAAPAPTAAAEAPRPTGAPRWGRGLDASQVLAMAAPPEGGVVVVGRFEGRAELDSGTIENVPSPGEGPKPASFVAELLPGGSVSWARPLTRNGGLFAEGVGLAPGGDILVLGSGRGVDFGDGERREAQSELSLVRLDRTGKLLAAHFFPGKLEVHATVFDRTGTVYAGGGFTEALEIGGTRLPVTPGNLATAFVLAIDASGKPLWARRFGTAGARVIGLALDPAGDLVIAGTAWGPFQLDGVHVDHHGGADVFVAKLDASGHARWARSAGDGMDQFAAGVAVDGRGEIIVSGRFDGRLELGGPPIEGLPTAQAGFLARLGPDGVPLRSHAYPHVQIQRIRADTAGDVVVTAFVPRDAGLGFELEAPPEKERTSNKGDMCLFRLDPSWRPRWGRRFADGIIVWMTLELDAQGSPLVGGWAQRSFRVGPRMLEHPSGPGGNTAFVAAFAP